MGKRLTLAAVRRFTRRALNEQGLGHVEIVDLKWQGQRSQYRDGSPIWFRVARVVLAGSDGRKVVKWANVATDGSFRIG